MPTMEFGCCEELEATDIEIGPTVTPVPHSLVLSIGADSVQLIVLLADIFVAATAVSSPAAAAAAAGVPVHVACAV